MEYLEYQLKEMDIFPASRPIILQEVEKWVRNNKKYEAIYKRWVNRVFFHCRDDIIFISILEKKYPSIKYSLYYVCYVVWDCLRDIKKIIY